MNKSTITRIMIGVFLLLLPILAVGFAIGKPIYEMNVKMAHLNAQADKKQEELSKLTIATGQQTHAESAVGGDGLTASADPDVSTYATANFDTNASLETILNDISTNLKKNNYSQRMIEGRPLYEGKPDPKLGVNSLGIAYYFDNDDKTVRVFFNFLEVYQDQDGILFERTPSSIRKSLAFNFKIYDDSQLKGKQIKSIDITYAKSKHFDSYN